MLRAFGAVRKMFLMPSFIRQRQLSRLHSLVWCFVLFIYLLNELSALSWTTLKGMKLKLCTRIACSEENDNLGDNYIIGVINHRLVCMVLIHIGLQSVLFYFNLLPRQKKFHIHFLSFFYLLLLFLFFYSNFLLNGI